MIQVATDIAETSRDHPASRVNGDISDLFFNLDFRDCELPKDERGQFGGWDDDKLNEQATWFLASLDRLGIHTPTAEELIANFYARI